MQYSYSRIKTYQECPLRYKLRYINKQPETNSPFEQGRRFHDLAEQYAVHCFERRLSSDLEYARRLATAFYGVDDELAKIFEGWAERQEFDWGLVIADGGSVERRLTRRVGRREFVGIIDLVLYNEAADEIIIRDYKLAYIPPETDPAPWQLVVYMWLAQGYWDASRWTLEMESAKFGTISRWPVDPELAALAQTWVEEWAERIETETRWEARPGPHCSMCPYLQLCDLPWPELVDDDSAAHIWALVEKEEARLRELRKAVRAYVEENGPVAFPDGRELAFWPPNYAKDGRAPTVVDPKAFARRCLDLDIDPPTPPPSTLVKLLDEHPELEDVIDWVAAATKLRAKKAGPAIEQPQSDGSPDDTFADM